MKRKKSVGEEQLEVRKLGVRVAGAPVSSVLHRNQKNLIDNNSRESYILNKSIGGSSRRLSINQKIFPQISEVKEKKSGSELFQLFVGCMNALSNNRISVSNAFDVALIDHLDEFVNLDFESDNNNGKYFENEYLSSDSHGLDSSHSLEFQKDMKSMIGEEEIGKVTSVNFSRVSTAIEGASRVYCYRVEAVYDQALKILSAISKSRQSAENEQILLTNSKSKKKKRKIEFQGGSSTLVNMNDITRKNIVEKKYHFNPFFLNLSSKCDHASIKGLFLTNLQLDSNLEFQLDGSSAAPLKPSTLNQTDENNVLRVDLKKLKDVMKSNDLSEEDICNLKICPQLNFFRNELNNIMKNTDSEEYDEETEINENKKIEMTDNNFLLDYDNQFHNQNYNTNKNDNENDEYNNVYEEIDDFYCEDMQRNDNLHEEKLKIDNSIFQENTNPTFEESVSFAEPSCENEEDSISSLLWRGEAISLENRLDAIDQNTFSQFSFYRHKKTLANKLSDSAKAVSSDIGLRKKAELCNLNKSKKAKCWKSEICEVDTSNLFVRFEGFEKDSKINRTFKRKMQRNKLCHPMFIAEDDTGFVIPFNENRLIALNLVLNKLIMLRRCRNPIGNFNLEQVDKDVEDLKNYSIYHEGVEILCVNIFDRYFAKKFLRRDTLTGSNDQNRKTGKTEMVGQSMQMCRSSFNDIAEDANHELSLDDLFKTNFEDIWVSEDLIAQKSPSMLKCVDPINYPIKSENTLLSVAKQSKYVDVSKVKAAMNSAFVSKVNALSSAGKQEKCILDENQHDKKEEKSAVGLEFGNIIKMTLENLDGADKRNCTVHMLFVCLLYSCNERVLRLCQSENSHTFTAFFGLPLEDHLDDKSL